jgi:hypothetical protein
MNASFKAPFLALIVVAHPLARPQVDGKRRVRIGVKWTVAASFLVTVGTCGDVVYRNVESI